MKKAILIGVSCLMILCSGCSALAEGVQNLGHSKNSQGDGFSLFGLQETTPATTPETTAATTAPVPETTAPPTTEATAPTTMPMETIPVVTRPPETTPQYDQSYGGYNSGSYLQKIYIGQSIYSGPGYGYSYVRGVEETNNYTIVDEAYDFDGRLWGKLKSGIGWVDLTDIRSGGYDYDFDYDFEYNDYYGTYYSVNYIAKIKDANCPIYSTPSYNGGYVGTVQEAGSYTIVQETCDEYGRLWGKLKSGLGWVCLSDYT